MFAINLIPERKKNSREAIEKFKFSPSEFITYMKRIDTLDIMDKNGPRNLLILLCTKLKRYYRNYELSIRIFYNIFVGRNFSDYRTIDSFRIRGHHRHLQKSQKYIITVYKSFNNAAFVNPTYRYAP